MRWIIFGLLLALLLISAKPFEYEELTLVQDVSGDIIVVPKDNNYQIQYFEAYLDLFPKQSYRQSEVSQSNYPQASSKDNQMVFRWNDPKELSLKFQTRSELTTKSIPRKISEKIDYPIDDVPPSIQKYLDTTDNIDINNDIRKQAIELASNEDDLYVITYKLAEWVNKHVSYNLSTLTSNANKPSSWVMKNRFGVCDEITNLFISMNRALGIPARFVSGIAYTDSELFDENWGNHGWAEVYFPEYGWVPFDVTYEQYGFVDATHIALSYQVDGSHPSVEYFSRGYDFDFKAQPLQFDTAIKANGNLRRDYSTYKIEFKENKVGFGSYNLITITIDNPQPFYVAESIIMGETTDLTIYGEQRPVVLLAPKQTLELKYLVQVSGKLDNNYMYTFPVSFLTTTGKEISKEFTVQQSADVYSKEYMEQFVNQKIDTSSIFINCETPEPLSSGETRTVSCDVQAPASEYPLEACMTNQCHTLKSKAELKVEYTIAASEVGVSTIPVNVQGKNQKKQFFITYKVEDIAALEIEQVTIPEEISYDDQGTLSIVVKKKTISSPVNASLTIDHTLIEQRWDFERFDEHKQFDLLVSGDVLNAGENEFLITLEYTDNEGSKHSITKTATTKLTGLTGEQRLLVGMNYVGGVTNKALGKYIRAITGEQDMKSMVNLLTIIVFILVILAGVKGLFSLVTWIVKK